MLATNPEDSVLLDPSVPVEDIAILMAQATTQRAVITYDGGQRFFEIINGPKNPIKKIHDFWQTGSTS